MLVEKMFGAPQVLAKVLGFEKSFHLWELCIGIFESLVEEFLLGSLSQLQSFILYLGFQVCWLNVFTIVSLWYQLYNISRIIITSVVSFLFSKIIKDSSAHLVIQLLPIILESHQSFLDLRSGMVTQFYKPLPCFIYIFKSDMISSHLSFKGLVLLKFWQKIGQIPVRFITGQNIFCLYPIWELKDKQKWVSLEEFKITSIFCICYKKNL